MGEKGLHRSVTLMRDAKEGFGFNIVGSTRSTHSNALKGIFVSKVTPAGRADESGKIFVGDEIIECNGRNLQNSTHLEAVAMLKSSGSTLQLTLAANNAGFARYAVAMPDLVDGARSPGLMRPRASTDTATGGVSGLSRPRSKTDAAQTPSIPAHEALIHVNKVASCPDHEITHVRIGQGMLEAGEGKKAEEHFLLALHTSIDPRLTKSLISAGQIADPQEAQEACRRVVEKGQKQKAGVFYLLGLALAHQDRTQDAQLPFLVAIQQCLPWYYHQSMTIDPKDADFHHNIGSALCAQGKYDYGRTAFEEAIRLRPDRVEWQDEWDRLTTHTGYSKPNGIAEVTSVAAEEKIPATAAHH